MPVNVINEKPKADWKPGDACYAYVPWACLITNATVASVSTADQTVSLSCPFAGDPAGIPFYRLFPTEKSANKALRKANYELRKAYETRITSVPELLQFALDEKVSISKAEEYTDGLARAAFISRAKALLGIKLKD